MEVTLIHLRLVLFVTIVAAVLLSCAAQKTEEQIRMEELADEILNSGKPVYMAHNLWFENPHRIESINFNGHPHRIAAGAEIETIRLAYKDPSASNKYIRFRIKGDDEDYRLVFQYKYQSNGQRKLTSEELVARTFTTMPFQQMTAGLMQDEIDNIRQGTIQKGMSKKAVLMSWGYPPLHYTRDLDETRWYYWKKRLVQDCVYFDENGRMVDASWFGTNGNENEIIE